MTAISAIASFDQPSDESAMEIARRLTSPLPLRAGGAVTAFFVSIFTLGLLPLIVWPRRWSEFADADRDRFASLINFWRSRATPAQTQSLDSALTQMGRQSIFTVPPILILVFVGMMFLSLFNDGRSFDNIFRLTIGYGHRHVWFYDPYAFNLHFIWGICLLVGYIFHYLAVRNHIAAVQQASQTISEISTGPGVSRTLARCFGPSPLWIAAAVLLCLMNAWWGIPLVLAGSMQRRYARYTAPRLRGQLADQLYSRQGSQSAYCSTPGCGALRRAGANFCPRCGARF